MTTPTVPAAAFIRDGNTITLNLTDPAVTLAGTALPGSPVMGRNEVGAWSVLATPEKVSPGVVRVEATLDEGTVALWLPRHVPDLGPVQNLADEAAYLAGDLARLSMIPVLEDTVRRLVRHDYGLTAGSTFEEVRDVAEWAAADWDPAQVRAGRAVGFAASEAWLWSGAEGATPEAILDWWTVDSPEGSDRRFWFSQWLEVGITSPRFWVAGLWPSDAEFMREAGIPLEELWPLCSKRVCPAVAAVGYRQGRTFAQVERFAALLRRSGPAWCTHKTAVNYRHRCEWNDASSIQVAETLRSMRGLDLDDVIACIAAGMSPKRARQHVRAGREMAPIRLVAALH